MTSTQIRNLCIALALSAYGLIWALPWAIHRLSDDRDLFLPQLISLILVAIVIVLATVVSFTAWTEQLSKEEHQRERLMREQEELIRLRNIKTETSR
jgi:Tfp pilus assembly protein PilN